MAGKSLWAGQDVGTSRSSHPRWQFLSAVDERFARPGRGCRKIAFELFGAGLTTAQVGDLFEKLYGRHYSKSSVSRMFDYAREEVLGWLLRPLDEYFPIVYIDALFWSTKRDGAVSKEAYYTILGVKSDRTREVLAIVNFPTESASGWEEVLRDLQKRGVKRLGLIVADGLSGLETAAARGVMPDSSSVIFLLGKVSMTRTAYERKVPKLEYEQKRFVWAEKNT